MLIIIIFISEFSLIMASKKCSRGANYTREEKHRLLNSVEKYMAILENKKTDAVTWKEKENAWGMIAIDYNTISGQCERSQTSLKVCYENLKKNVRKAVKCEENARKVDIFKTIEASGNLNHDPLHMNVMSEMPHTGEPLESQNDNGAIYHKLLENIRKHLTPATKRSRPSSNCTEIIIQEHDAESVGTTIVLPSSSRIQSGHQLTILPVGPNDGDLPCVTEALDWSNHSVKMVQTQINYELDPINQQAASSSSNTLSYPSTRNLMEPSRRRHSLENPSTAQVAEEKYDTNLTEAKLELVRLQIKFLKKDAIRKQLMEEQDLEFRKKAENEQNDIKLDILKMELEMKKKVLRAEELQNEVKLEILKTELQIKKNILEGKL